MSDHFGTIPIRQQQPASPGKKPRKRTKAPVKKSKERVKKPDSRKKIWYWLSVCSVLFILYCIIGFFIFPYYLTNIFPGRISKSTGFTLNTGQITFNPLTFRLTSQDGPVLYQAGKPVISLQSFQADLAPLLLLRNDLVCNSITIDKLDVDITRKPDGSYNFKKLFSDDNDTTSSEIMNFSDLPFFFSLNNITVRNSKVVFHDEPTGKVHTIDNIQLDLPTLSNIPFQADKYIRPRFSAIVNGSPVTLSGKAHMGDSEGDTLVTNLSCDINSFNLSLYAGYLPFELPFALNGGKADGTIELNFDPASKKKDKLSVTFDLQISDAKILNHTQSIAITTPALDLKGDILPVSKTLHIASIVIRAPKITSYGNSLLKNASGFLQHHKQLLSPATPETAPFSLLLDLLIVDNGTLQISPDKQSQSLKTTWNSLELSIKNFSSLPPINKKGDKGSFRFSGENDNGSYFSWHGQLISPQTVSGELNLNKIPSQELLNFLDNQNRLNIKGRSDLDGTLTLFRKQTPANVFALKLADADITFQNFSLQEGKTKIISAPVLKLSSFYSTDKSVDFGNVSLQNALLQFPYKKLPLFYSSFLHKKYTLQSLDYSGRTILLNKKGSPLIKFPSFTLGVTSFNTKKKDTTNLSLLAKTGKNGVIKATGHIQLAPFSLSLKTGFNSLSAPKVFSWLSGSTFLQKLKGKLSGNGSLSLPQLKYIGELRLESAVTQTKEETTLNWGNVYIQGMSFTARPFHLGITEADFEAPQLIWYISKKAVDPMHKFALFLQNQIPEIARQFMNKKRISISPIDIQEVNFNNGMIQIFDRRLTPGWEAEIENFNGNISGIHSAVSADASKYSFKGLLDDSKFEVDGETALFSPDANGHYTLSIEAYPLASFHKQLTDHTDINTEKGELDLHLTGQWEKKQFEQSGTLLLSDIESAGPDSESALPLALLTGPDNTFSIDFNYKKPAITKNPLLERLLAHFQTLIVKSSVSPLLLAGNNFTDLIDHEFIECNPGKSELSDKGRETLTQYIALLRAHPHIGLTLSSRVDIKSDSKVLKNQLELLEKKRVDLENRKNFILWQKKKTEYEHQVKNKENSIESSGKIVEVDIPASVLTEYVPLKPHPVSVSEEMLLELARKRAEAVHQNLLTHINLQPDQVVVAETVLPGQTDQPPLHGVKITLRAINSIQPN